MKDVIAAANFAGRRARAAIKKTALLLKGESDGHPFRGNQYTSGSGGGGGSDKSGGFSAVTREAAEKGAPRIRQEAKKIGWAQAVADELLSGDGYDLLTYGGAKAFDSLPEFLSLSPDEKKEFMRDFKAYDSFMSDIEEEENDFYDESEEDADPTDKIPTSTSSLRAEWLVRRDSHLAEQD